MEINIYLQNQNMRYNILQYGDHIGYKNICLYWSSALNSLHTAKEDGAGKLCSKWLNDITYIFIIWLSNERYVHYLSIQLIVYDRISIELVTMVCQSWVV